MTREKNSWSRPRPGRDDGEGAREHGGQDADDRRGLRGPGRSDSEQFVGLERAKNCGCKSQQTRNEMA